MTRDEAINKIDVRLADLPDDRVATLAELAEAFAKPTFYPTMSPAQTDELIRSIAEADLGEVLPSTTVFATIARRHGIAHGA